MSKKKVEEIDLRVISSALEKQKLSLREFLILYLYYTGGSITQQELNSLVEKKCLVPPELFLEQEDYSISSSGKGRVEAVIAESSDSEVSTARLESLALAMKQIYPRGKKPGTNIYWSEGTLLIMRRLKMFFAKYGNDFTDEQILQATTRYVEDKNEDPTMRLLKYFIFKEPIGAGGEVEPTSDLLTYIENMSEETEDEKQWGENLR